MQRSTLIAVAVFAALLAAVLLRVGRHTERGISRISFAGIEVDAVDRVEIGGENAVELSRQGETWHLAGGREAQAGAVQRALEAIPGIVSSELVTEDPDHFAAYQVDDEQGTAVRAVSGERELASFVIGKQAPGGAFVRVEGRVYRVRGLFPGLFSRPPSSWIERRLFRDSPAKVARLEVRLAGRDAYALVRRNNRWEMEDPSLLPEGFRFDPEAAGSLVRRVLTLSAVELLDRDPGIETTGLGEGADRIRYLLEGEEGGGERHTLRLGAGAEGSRVYARTSDRHEVVLVSEPSARSLRKAPTDLRDLHMVQLDPDRVTELRIADGPRHLVLARKEGTWEIARSTEEPPGGFELDPRKVDARLSTLANARAVSLAERHGERETGLARPPARITARLDDDSLVTLAFGRRTRSDGRDLVYARGNADDRIYRAAAFLRKTLTGGLETLRRTASRGAPSIDPAALSRLPPEVRRALEQQVRQEAAKQQALEKIRSAPGHRPDPRR